MDAYRESGYLCPVNESFSAQATEVAAGVEADRAIAEALFRWVRDEYVYDMTKIRGAQHLLDARPRRAVSFDKSNLLVSLLRSSDIPARFRLLRCTFHNAYQDRKDEAIHAPVEVYLDGEWVTADPAFGPHTDAFRAEAAFGEETWTAVKSEKTVAALPRWLVYAYNYLMRFAHPTVRQVRTELRECQDMDALDR